ncbi:hypothetical protein R3W88_019501 [Solanum pinnatisectum]|uniref:Retrotransposon gag domain-containing protein n=1 Tax=Solanum pinnatisectum TaxID=50273 RepID=A0AAV9KJW9_9SOLN|nr:hypothetical protein R3W88_019501 [Solanum pinnatisectum]
MLNYVVSYGDPLTTSLYSCSIHSRCVILVKEKARYLYTNDISRFYDVTSRMTNLKKQESDIESLPLLKSSLFTDLQLAVREAARISVLLRDDLDLDGAGATGTIMLLALPPGVKFTITSTIIQLLNLKGMFSGATGDDLKEAFLERFFPKSKELQMKDEISTHKQLPGEAMHDTWWRFSKKLKKCPNHDLTERPIKKAFYRSLNCVTKPVVDAVYGGSFMRKPFSESVQLLDEVSKNNRAWYTRDAEVRDLGYTYELSVEQRKREEERDQDMAHKRTQIDILTKHLVSKSERSMLWVSIPGMKIRTSI